MTKEMIETKVMMEGSVILFSDSGCSSEEKYNEIANEDKINFDNTQKKFKKTIKIVNLIKKKK
jgi:uncharacterized protein (UPF0179 family)